MVKFCKTISIFIILLLSINAHASYILIPMNPDQSDHLKAYGVTYWTLQQGGEIWWLLNYEGGSFVLPNSTSIASECKTRGVSFRVISDGEFNQILQTINDPDVNMEAIKMEKAPRIAVYTPEVNERGEKINPWDDAVTLALTYAEIPYDVVYDEEIMSGVLPLYDWLHLHHEDFTGQYGKFWANYRNAQWYINDVRENEATARKLGFNKVSQLKLAVAKKIRDFVSGGGYMFAMCSAPDSFDIALAADGVDICDVPFDGDPIDPYAQKKLNFVNNSINIHSRSNRSKKNDITFF